MSHELDQIREAMSEVERLEAELAAAKERRTQLATRLYRQNGPTRTYRVHEAGVRWVDGKPPAEPDSVELIISRTKPRKDGSVSYFFAEKQRWKGPARPTGTPEAVAEAVAHMESVPSVFTYTGETPLTGRVLEATAVLTGRAEAGRGEETPSLLDRIGASESERELYSKAQLPPEETARLSGALDAAMEAAPAAIEAADELIRSRARLPIARLEAPEPKLLQITEEGEAQPRPTEPDIDPDQAILDELLAGME